MPYFVAGYPSFRACREYLWEAAEAGADMIELGIPFSDPVADGPTIQAATHAALESGVTVRRTLQFARSLAREEFPIPILGMTYANLLHAPGYERSARTWRHAGISGAIVPDLPVEESGPLRRTLHQQGLAYVALASPTTGRGRLRHVLAASSGFVYLVAVLGTTGARTGLSQETEPLLRRVRRERAGPRPPVCVGFGVSGPEPVRRLHKAGADGVIVGSALVDRIRRGEAPTRLLRAMARAGRAA